MKASIKIIILFWIVVSYTSLTAQNCSSLSGIINTYAPVTNISGNVITRGTTTGATAPFAVGDYVVLIQMTGISPAHATSNMGKYELRTITAVSGTSITLSTITNTYSFSTEKVQLVRAPYCSTGTVSATVTAKLWDGFTGGVIALKGSTLTLNANIDATGTGFSQANPPTTTLTTSLSSGQGSTNGRGSNGIDYGVNGGGGSVTGGSGRSGGGVGGGGGSGGTGNGTSDLLRANGGTGGGTGGGGGGGQAPNPGDGSMGAGNDGGSGGANQRSIPFAAYLLGAGGGGGGGIIGGGGGGAGGGTSTSGFGGSGAGGGVSGGGGGGGGYNGNPNYVSGGGGGGGTKGVGNGRNASCYDSGSGSGGGSYGGGGGGASALLGGDDSSGGGGGGSWTGGGTAGKFGFNQYRNGGAGNAAVTTVIGNTDHYLNTTQPRIMMGGAGGNAQCQSEGKGGGIIILEFNDIQGNTNSIKSNGGSLGLAPSFCLNINNGIGGAGGGGGGQIVLNVKTYTTTTIIEAKGGKGGDGNFSPNGSGNLWHGGTGGAGGGGGGIWIYGSSISTNTGGQTVTVVNTNLTSAGNSDSATLGGLAGSDTRNPKNGYRTGTGGAGGNGLIVMSSDVPVWPNEICTITNLTATPGTCTPSNNQYSVSGSISFSNAPTTGTLTVSVGSVTQTFNAPFTSPQAYTLTGLTSGSGSQTVTAVFSANAVCTATQTYTAPASCQCVISGITAAPGACSTNNNSYTLTGQVTFNNAPTAGTLIISVLGGNSVTLSAPFTTSIPYSISNLNADGMSHTVTATFSDDILCTNTQSYTAPVQCAIPCPPSNFNFCGGDTYTLTAPAGYSGYQWYTVVGMTETPIPGAMSNIYIATMPGTYIYRAIDNGACAIDLCCPVTLNDVRPLLSCTGTVTPSCGQSNGSATVSAVGGAGGYTYRWGTSPQQTSATATNLAAGTYIVTVTDSGGCSNTCQVVLTPPNSPTCLASVLSNPGCGLMNGSATVAPSGGNGIYTYTWSTTPTQTTQTAVGLGAGAYNVTVTDSNVCSNTCSVTLTTPNGPTCSATANTQPTCANLSGGSATVSGSGGSGSYSYAWSNGMSGAMVSGLEGGTYTVTVTDSNNCQSTCQVTIDTPQNCCNISVISQISVCDDNGTPSKATDNRIQTTVLVSNENNILTTYTISIGQGTSVTPISGTYGSPQTITLGPGTAGGGAAFTVTFTDVVNGVGCVQTLEIIDPGNCASSNPVPPCETPKCGTATIRVNGN